MPSGRRCWVEGCREPAAKRWATFCRHCIRDATEGEKWQMIIAAWSPFWPQDDQDAWWFEVETLRLRVAEKVYRRQMNRVWPGHFPET